MSGATPDKPDVLNGGWSLWAAILKGREKIERPSEKEIGYLVKKIQHTLLGVSPFAPVNEIFKEAFVTVAKARNTRVLRPDGDPAWLKDVDATDAQGTLGYPSEEEAKEGEIYISTAEGRKRPITKVVDYVINMGDVYGGDFANGPKLWPDIAVLKPQIVKWMFSSGDKFNIFVQSEGAAKPAKMVFFNYGLPKIVLKEKTVGFRKMYELVPDVSQTAPPLTSEERNAARQVLGTGVGANWPSWDPSNVRNAMSNAYVRPENGTGESAIATVATVASATHELSTVVSTLALALGSKKETGEAAASAPSSSHELSSVVPTLTVALRSKEETGAAAAAPPTAATSDASATHDLSSVVPTLALALRSVNTNGVKKTVSSTESGTVATTDCSGLAWTVPVLAAALGVLNTTTKQDVSSGGGDGSNDDGLTFPNVPTGPIDTSGGKRPGGGGDDGGGGGDNDGDGGGLGRRREEMDRPRDDKRLRAVRAGEVTNIHQRLEAGGQLRGAMHSP